MDLDELKQLINLMNDNGLSRLEVEEDGRHYRLEKGGPAPTVSAYPMPSFGAGSMIGQGFSGAAPATPTSPAVPEDTVTFNSPMVGTFYASSSPENPPFVKAGDRITRDTVVCIIEAMKVFNEIKAEMSGTVLEVLTDNAEAVEYGQPILLIRPE